MSALRELRRGVRAHMRGDHVRAMRIYRRLLKADPLDPGALYFAGLLAYQLRQTEVAWRWMTLAATLAPDHAEAHYNVGLIAHERGDLSTAEEAYRAALAVDPAFTEAHANLGNLLAEQHRLDEADAEWDHAIDGEPKSEEGRFNRAMLLLARGEFARGWAEYEHRWAAKGFVVDYGRPDLARIPVWDGRPVDGPLLIHAEQGYGDTIQFARYLPLAAARAATLRVECQDALVRLFRRSFPGIEIFGRADPRPRTARAQCALMSLPHRCGTTLETIPHTVPYLVPPPGVASPWARDIGICWRGNPNHRNDRNRSIPRALFEPFFAQWGAIDLVPDPARLPTWDTTAAVVAQLRLVITVDTSIAHLAGALGVPTWLLVPAVHDWRWLRHREDSPWYPTMRLFRQTHAGDWAPVLERVVQAMRPQAIAHA